MPLLVTITQIILMGFFVGQIARRLGLPSLMGMILVGIVLGPQVGDRIAPEVLQAGDSLRTIAVMVILMKAGLGLDREKLTQQGSVALRLGLLPALGEAIAIAFGSMWLFKFNFPTGLLLGCIIGAESPAVIVPGMLRLKSLGWGVSKGIPDAILTGSALSDVLLLLIFSLLLTFLGQKDPAPIILPGGLTITPWQFLPVQIILQIGLGVLLGWFCAGILVSLLTKQNWTQNLVQDGLVTAGLSLWLVILAVNFPLFSGYLAVMTTGFFLIEMDPPLARRLRNCFDSLWTIAEIILFVLLGASIQLNLLGNIFWTGLVLLTIGTLIGRSLGWYLSTLKSNWTWKERLFLLPGNSAKATVQAAIGAIPLAQGINGGETILSLAALSILLTAPLGAWAIPTFAPKLLERGEVDPTKVLVSKQVKLLAAIDVSTVTMEVLTKAADLARRSDGEVIVLHVSQTDHPPEIEILEHQVKQILADIRHQFLILRGSIPESIIHTAQNYGETEIIMGQQNQYPDNTLVIGSVTQKVLASSTIPVVIVKAP
jgi:NhaP-type Na+/H+ or K+/H+ antiporter